MFTNTKQPSTLYHGKMAKGILVILFNCLAALHQWDMKCVEWRFSHAQLQFSETNESANQEPRPNCTVHNVLNCGDPEGWINLAGIYCHFFSYLGFEFFSIMDLFLPDIQHETISSSNQTLILRAALVVCYLLKFFCISLHKSPWSNNFLPKCYCPCNVV